MKIRGKNGVLYSKDRDRYVRADDRTIGTMRGSMMSCLRNKEEHWHIKKQALGISAFVVRNAGMFGIKHFHFYWPGKPERSGWITPAEIIENGEVATYPPHDEQYFIQPGFFSHKKPE